MEEYEEDTGEENYPTTGDMPHPDHKIGPTPSIRYDADTLNFLENTITDSFYNNLISRILNSRLTQDGKDRLLFLADKYIKPFEYIITNTRSDFEFRQRQNDLRMDFMFAKSGLRLIDHNNTFISILSAMQNHYTGAKLTRSRNGFERVAQQTQRAELTSKYEKGGQNKPEPTGLNRLIRGSSN